MEKKDLLQPENENLKIAFIFGAVLYDELTEERTKPISKEQAETLTDEEIELIFIYTVKLFLCNTELPVAICLAGDVKTCI